MVDLTKGFFFSYNYPLQSSVQHNILRAVSVSPSSPRGGMFVWNARWREAAGSALSPRWLVSLIHGVFLQERCVLQGRQFQLTLIARRSR